MAKQRQNRVGALGAIGAFLLVFGVWLIVATFFTPTAYGKVTNLVAAIIIGGFGAAAVFFDKRSRHTSGTEGGERSDTGVS